MSTCVLVRFCEIRELSNRKLCQSGKGNQSPEDATRKDSQMLDLMLLQRCIHQLSSLKRGFTEPHWTGGRKDARGCLPDGAPRGSAL